MEIKICNFDTGKKVDRTRSVPSMCKTKTVDAQVLVAGKAYMLNIKTFECHKERDTYNIYLVEDPYGEDVRCAREEEHKEYFLRLKRLIMQRKKKIYHNKYNDYEIDAPLERVMFWVSGKTADCTFCDVVWLTIHMTKYKTDFYDSVHEDYVVEIPFFIEHNPCEI